MPGVSAKDRHQSISFLSICFWLQVFILCRLLLQQKAAPTIPPVVVSTVKAAILDPAFYEERLKTIWSRNHTNTAQDRLAQLATDIAGLATVLPYGRAMMRRRHRLPSAVIITSMHISYVIRGNMMRR